MFSKILGGVQIARLSPLIADLEYARQNQRRFWWAWTTSKNHLANIPTIKILPQGEKDRNALGPDELNQWFVIFPTPGRLFLSLIVANCSRERPISRFEKNWK